MDMRESKRLFVFFRVWKISKFAQGLGFRADAGPEVRAISLRSGFWAVNHYIP